MPNDEFVTLDNLGRFKRNVDGELAGKADVSDVYDKTEVGTLLSGKQDALTAGQLANIADIPNKQAQLTASQLEELDATAIPNGTIDILLGTASIDPILANNSWETIKAVCQLGKASDFWSVGDTKTDTGTDSVTRTFRIADMSGLYGKHVVFDQVELENTDYQWQGTKIDGFYNNYSTSNMRKSFFYNDIHIIIYIFERYLELVKINIKFLNRYFHSSLLSLLKFSDMRLNIFFGFTL